MFATRAEFPEISGSSYSESREMSFWARRMFFGLINVISRIDFLRNLLGPKDSNESHRIPTNPNGPQRKSDRSINIGKYSELKKQFSARKNYYWQVAKEFRATKR